MKLYIDTSSNQQTVVGLDKARMVKGANKAHSQVVLPMVQALLKKTGKTLQDITEIEVNPGPGSYTGLRVGVAIANALGYVLKIPVNGRKVDKLEIVEPIYE